MVLYEARLASKDARVLCGGPDCRHQLGVVTENGLTLLPYYVADDRGTYRLSRHAHKQRRLNQPVSNRRPFTFFDPRVRKDVQGFPGREAAGWPVYIVCPDGHRNVAREELLVVPTGDRPATAAGA